MKWIPIYKKKPLKDQVVLLLTSGNIVIGKFDGAYFNDDGLLIENITHWCAIPEIKNIEKVKPYNYHDVE